MYSQTQEQADATGIRKPSQVIDLRSDTVTKPTPEMRLAMFEAEVGDDVYAEDPTINRLEQRAAEIFGREAAIFVPTGSMGNQIAIKIHTKPGQEIICEERGHIFNYEMATLASFSGCLVRPIYAEGGALQWDQVKKKVAAKTYYMAQTGLVSLENTHNMAGGTVYPTEVAEEICDGAHELGLPVHLDGARVFNAATAVGRPVAEITKKFDSVMFCLSKGLGAPVGSVLVGGRAFITEARKYRKALGGGMRQAGILAAAGLIALEKMPARLHEDHANARYLATELAKLPGIAIDLASVQTNIVVVEVAGTGMNGAELIRRVGEKGLKIGSGYGDAVRFVTHMDVDRAGCEAAVEIVRETLKAS
jgi:threonine aldolase